MKIDGLPVIDAKKKIKIVISSADIKDGKAKRPDACAAALACIHAVKNCTQARVHLGRTYLKIKKQWLRYYTPESLRGEIVAFDRGGRFQLGEYTLAPLTGSNLLGGHSGSETNRTRSKKLHKKRRPYHVVEGVRHFGANR